MKDEFQNIALDVGKHELDATTSVTHIDSRGLYVVEIEEEDDGGM